MIAPFVPQRLQRASGRGVIDSGRSLVNTARVLADLSSPLPNVTKQALAQNASNAGSYLARTAPGQMVSDARSAATRAGSTAKTALTRSYSPEDIAYGGTRILLEGALVVAGGGAVRATGRVVAAERGAVWKLGPGPRGEAIEVAFGKNLFPDNFPIIDRFNNGIATSIKSIDLNGTSYLTGNGLRNTLTRYVDSVAGYTGTGPKGWGGTIIRQSEINSRGLDIVVPHAGNAAQQQIISDIIKYGSTRPNPVTVNVFTYP